MRQQLQQFTLLVITILSAAVSALQLLYPSYPIPYHTLILTGEAWVSELLQGHPKQIHCKLGVHLHVFQALLSELHSMGHKNSWFIKLEEQLTIFLYCCVTGLTIWHVGERFQKSNETISWWALWLGVRLAMRVFNDLHQFEAISERWTLFSHPRLSTWHMFTCRPQTVMYLHGSATIQSFGHFSRMSGCHRWKSYP